MKYLCGSQQNNGKRSKKEAVLTVSVQEDERVVRQRGDGVGSDVEAELGLHDSEGLLGAGGKQAGVVETLDDGALAARGAKGAGEEHVQAAARSESQRNARRDYVAKTSAVHSVARPRQALTRSVRATSKGNNLYRQVTMLGRFL
jgi:hypothetical protein